MTSTDVKSDRGAWRERIYIVIFESDTPAGRAFDLALLAAILVSVACVTAESIPSVSARWSRELFAAELTLTTLFAIEYVLRLISARGARTYAWSTYGVLDLIGVVGPLVALVVPGMQALSMARLARVLRVLRVLRLSELLMEADTLTTAVRASARKIGLFLFFVAILVTILGAVMYLIEGPSSGFTSIPIGVYWAIVTVTTVGYGDVTPVTALGRGVAALAMLLGYAMLAVPTGIVVRELGRAERRSRACTRCGVAETDVQARWCRRCAERLPGDDSPIAGATT